jgi:hypothetical protein
MRNSGLIPCREKRSCLKMFIMTLAFIQPHILRQEGFLHLVSSGWGVKQTTPPPSNAEIKNEWSHNSIDTYTFMACTGTYNFTKISISKAEREPK